MIDVNPLAGHARRKDWKAWFRHEGWAVLRTMGDWCAVMRVFPTERGAARYLADKPNYYHAVKL